MEKSWFESWPNGLRGGSYVTYHESGVSSGSPSDLEELAEKSKSSPRHSTTLPHPHPSRALKRLSSEPGTVCPPPPPPPPPEDTPSQPASMPASPVSGRNSVDSMDQEERSPSASSGPKKPSPPEQPTEEQQQPQPEYGEHGHEEEHSKSGHTLVNKQMVLPFIPPKFPNQTTNSDSLIKPSEYLRSLSHIRPTSQPPQPPSATVATSNGVINGTLQRPVERETTPVFEEQSSVAGKTPPREDASPAPGPPPAPPAAGPPPPPLPVTDPKEDDPFSTATRKLQQPLGTISIQELNSVQLRRTDKMMAAKTLSAPARPGVNGEPFLTQKDDLIAELKMSKDISGIKKLKVERAKVEERQEKEMFTEITKQLNANTFVEKFPDKDVTNTLTPRSNTSCVVPS
uniref:Uncharacterized protein n=1 Tax=Timema bartmani TaxID=61472 RepID=A0A7R9I098_9NEOP|nr:unnamed protein product [Timema bartmani]